MHLVKPGDHHIRSDLQLTQKRALDPYGMPWALLLALLEAAWLSFSLLSDTSCICVAGTGPLEGGDVVVLLLNAGNGTTTINTSFADIGLGSQVTTVKAVDLWTGKSAGLMSGSTVSESVASHDSAVLRLSPVSN